MASCGGGDFLTSEEDSNDEDGWQEEQEVCQDLMRCCLFCESNFGSAEEIFTHCAVEHNFHIGKAKRKFVLESLSYIRMINYIREKKPSSLELCIMKDGDSWSNDKFMSPVHRDDVLLMFDIEMCESEDEDEVQEEDNVTLSRKQYSDLLRKMKMAESKASHAENTLQSALSNIESLKKLAQSYFLSDADSTVAECNKSEVEDNSYFSGYSHFSIHHEMLQDKVRTISYKQAILNNCDLFKNKIVLDVGCGTGILSLFAATAGAKKCYAVDQSDIIYQTMDIVKENKLENKITIIKERMEDAQLNVEKVDVIISEWMGYFLFFECMLDTVVWARDRYLKPKGIMMPNRCTLSIAGISDPQRYGNMIGFWDDVYGFKMSCMKKEALKEVSIESVDAKWMNTSEAIITDVNLRTCTINALEFSSPFTLVVNDNRPVIALIAYFDVYFDLNNTVSFSTSPAADLTHWKQSVFYLENPLSKKAGDVIYGDICCRRNEKDPRTLIVYLHVDGKPYRYIIQ